MATKATLLVSIFLAFGANQVCAGESKGGYRLAQAEKNKAANESGIFQGNARMAAEENFSNAESVGTSSHKALVTTIRFLRTGTTTRMMIDLSQLIRCE